MQVMCTLDFDKLLPMCLLEFQPTKQVVSTLYFLVVSILLKSLIYIVKMCDFFPFIFIYLVAHVWGSEDNMQEMYFSFHNVVSRGFF